MVPVVTTLPERIKKILDTQGISARELGRRAGFKSSQLSVQVRNLESDPGAITLRSLKAIAAAAHVSLAWLVTGEGEELETALTSPSRDAAAIQAQDDGVWVEAVRSVLAEALTDETAPKPVAWWVLRMQTREIEMIDEAKRRGEDPRTKSGEQIIRRPRGLPRVTHPDQSGAVGGKRKEPGETKRSGK